MRKYLLLVVSLYGAMYALAQVHVRDEPRHRNVFENRFVRILDVHLGPKDTTLYHLHNTPSVFIVFTNTKVGSQLPGGEPQKGANVNGDISYDNLASPRVHRVWNEDTSWFHVIDIELTGKNQLSNQAIMKNDLLTLLFDEKEVTGYKVQLKQKQRLELRPAAKGYLLISLSAATVDYKTNDISEFRFMKPGHYLWIDSGKNSFLSLPDQTPASFVLLELK